jgi:hypothetical protein
LNVKESVFAENDHVKGPAESDSYSLRIAIVSFVGREELFRVKFMSIVLVKRRIETGANQPFDQMLLGCRRARRGLFQGHQNPSRTEGAIAVEEGRVGHVEDVLLGWVKVVLLALAVEEASIFAKREI